jgi:hypothetical protein
VIKEGILQLHERARRRGQRAKHPRLQRLRACWQRVGANKLALKAMA